MCDMVINGKLLKEEIVSCLKISENDCGHLSALSDNCKQYAKDLMPHIQECDVDNSISGSFGINSTLKISITKFLTRIKEGVSLELPSFPWVKTIRHMSYNNGLPTTKAYIQISNEPAKEMTKLNTSYKQLLPIINQQPLATTAGNIIAIVPTKNEDKTTRNSCCNRKIDICKCDSDMITYRHMPCDQMFPNKLKLSNSENLTSCDTSYPENLVWSCMDAGMNSCVQNNMPQVGSITELAVYKNHCYDALVHIQRTKAAIANSESVTASSTRYQPYFVRCVHQLHNKQCKHFLTNSPFTLYTITQPTLSNMYNMPPNMRTKCNGRNYTSLKQSKCEQQCPTFTPQNECWASMCMKSYCKKKQKNLRTKYQKLEEIVGRLKKTKDDDKNS